jgi:hypothetical protein
MEGEQGRRIEKYWNEVKESEKLPSLKFKQI